MQPVATLAQDSADEPAQLGIAAQTLQHRGEQVNVLCECEHPLMSPPRAVAPDGTSRCPPSSSPAHQRANAPSTAISNSSRLPVACTRFFEERRDQRFGFGDPPGDDEIPRQHRIFVILPVVRWGSLDREASFRPIRRAFGIAIGDLIVRLSRFGVHEHSGHVRAAGPPRLPVECVARLHAGRPAHSRHRPAPAAPESCARSCQSCLPGRDTATRCCARSEAPSTPGSLAPEANARNGVVARSFVRPDGWTCLKIAFALVF